MKTIGQKEFIVLMAMLMSFVALAIDAMLPALGQIGISLNVQNNNDIQLIISSIFLGMGFGLMIFGPLSDSYGRKPAIYGGIIIFIFGCIISYYSQTFEVMLLGRAFQGLGAASSRVITLAMIRDKYEGNAMAKIMSLIMIIFILVPAIAPSIGQAILIFGEWRYIFGFMGSLAAIGLAWFFVRQPETLKPEYRQPFRFSNILIGIKETVKNKTARSFTISSGLIFSSFVGYLSSSQQILQVQYGLGDMFSIYFGVLALSIGMASFANSRWVMKYGMLNLCIRSLKVLSSAAFIFIMVTYFFKGHPPLPMLMSYLMITFFCLGLLFGNFNALAVQPLGHIAGVANSVISSSQTLISVILGGTVGFFYNGTVFPMIIGFLIFGLCSLYLTVRISKAQKAIERAKS
ncbi:MAG: multidrug effflux MFS transporter [Bdellovibrionaceae bacterium]|jgi:MFS transporter, DHA1 family, multidrug resistance protein|nr:multidrug effflux MFS transporter [Pseudobdellovibrionaceae bacterium]